jgi:hypothetical protein
MKQCFKCNIKKSIEEFYKHSGMIDGHLGKCKQCCRVENITNRKKKVAYYANYEKHRFHDPKRKKQVMEASYRMRINHPNKYKARYTTSNALRDGKLIKGPCEVCKTKIKVQSHHDDYDKPMEVRWLCFQHHRELHGQKVYL